MNRFKGYEIAEKIELANGDSIILLNMLDACVLAAGKRIPDTDAEQNIYRIDKDGHVVWRISGVEPIEPGEPFVGMRINDRNQLEANSWCCILYLIDIDTGVASPIAFLR